MSEMTKVAEAYQAAVATPIGFSDVYLGQLAWTGIRAVMSATGLAHDELSRCQPMRAGDGVPLRSP